MGRYAVIEDNKVTNIIEAAGPDVLPGVVLMEAPDWTAIGDVLVDGELPGAPPEPEPDPETERLARIAQIEADLHNIDLASIRPLRAIDNGSDSPVDHQKLIELEEKAAALRAELAALYV